MYTAATELDPLTHNYSGIEASNLVGSSYVGSPANHLFQRSISSKTGSYCHSSFCDEFQDCPVRRVFSAGDLEGVSNYMAQRRKRADSPLSISEEKSIIIQGMMKVSKYSPEEKKERIERYRSKRRLRNFNKKIQKKKHQYECRKTLADSRARVKGRFVRNTTMGIMEEKSGYVNHVLNDEYSTTYHHHMMAAGDEDCDDEESSWINFLGYANSS
ncbi:hypothetical protein V2J09_007429 [Rumex salicifolius]